MHLIWPAIWPQNLVAVRCQKTKPSRLVPIESLESAVRAISIRPNIRLELDMRGALFCLNCQTGTNHFFAGLFISILDERPGARAMDRLAPVVCTTNRRLQLYSYVLY